MDSVLVYLVMTAGVVGGFAFLWSWIEDLRRAVAVEVEQRLQLAKELREEREYRRRAVRRYRRAAARTARETKEASEAVQVLDHRLAAVMEVLPMFAKHEEEPGGE